MGVRSFLPVDEPVCVAEFEGLARRRLSREVWDFIAGGSGTEVTLSANRAALDAVTLMPRVLTGATAADTSCRILRSRSTLPVAVAPMAYQRLVHPGGELASALAARDAGIPYVVSTLSSVRIEDVAAVGATTWFQLYWLRDRSMVVDMLARAHEVGVEAVMVTADVPVLGRRLRDVRNAFALPADVFAANLTDDASSAAHTRLRRGSAIATHTKELFAPALGWADLEWLRGQTDLPLVVKGLLDPRDAIRAAGLGADAVVVSNHGSRQLDGATASIAALPKVVDAVGSDCEVLMDSGLRSGTDVLRALALGASAVLLGRPVLWGLAVDGACGVRRVLELLTAELKDALTLAGCDTPGTARELAVLYPTAS